MDIIFATGNSHKLHEAEEILGVTLKMPSDLGIKGEIPENGNTLEDNSAEKAMYLWEKLGKTCFADDTGLEVEVLDGEPGVYTARYYSLPAKFSNWKMPENSEDISNANMSKLLAELKGKENRNAQFRTVVTLIKDGKQYQFDGVLKGKIAEQKSGHKGFGYDPVFIPNEYNCSLAELSSFKKNEISHRGKAMRALAKFIKETK